MRLPGVLGRAGPWCRVTEPRCLLEKELRDDPDGGAAPGHVHEVLRVPLPPPTADAFSQARRPAGTTVGEAGTSADNSGVTADFSTDVVRSVPPGISSAELGVTVVPAPGGGSLIRADAEVVWYPRRPAI